MKISIFGLGYVGAVSLACLVRDGHEVTGVDIDEVKLDLIKRGQSPIVEEGIMELMSAASASGRLQVTNDAERAILDTDLSFVCVGTPSRANGSQSLDALRRLAEQAGKALKQKAIVMGKLTFQEKGIALVMGATLFCWFGYGDQLGIANIAIISIVLLFVLNLITWKMVEAHINWAIVLMYGGAICLGEVMSESGAALWLAQQLFSGLIESSVVFLLVIA